MPPPLASKQGVAVDMMLPTAQTCFFDVHLPKYTSEEAMKKATTTSNKLVIRFKNYFVKLFLPYIQYV